MNIGRRVAQAAVVLSSAALALTGVVPASAASGGGGPVAQDVLGSGSDTTQFMMHNLDGLYLFSPGCNQLAQSGTTQWLDFSCGPDTSTTITTENYAHDQVHEANFLGSSNGIAQLCDQGTSVGGAPVAHVDYARSSRAPGTSDCSGLNFVAYARDGISVEAWNIAPTSTSTASGSYNMNNQSGTCAGSAAGSFCLSQSQLQGIFVTCTITNWSQVGGNNVPISIYTPQPGSGTRKVWDGFVGGDSSHCIPANQNCTVATSTCPVPHLIPENSNLAIPKTDQKKAIFPFSYGVWSTTVATSKGNKTRLAAVDNVAVNATTIGDGSFPYGRYLYNVYCSATAANGSASGCAANSGASSQAAVNYVGETGWICKDSTNHAVNPLTGNNFRTDIENTIAKAGFVPIPDGAVGGNSLASDHCRLFQT